MSELKERLIESIIHSIIIMLVYLLITYVINLKLTNVFFLLIGSIIAIIFLVSYIRRSYNKEQLLYNSWICMASVIFIGSLIGRYIPLVSLISFGAVISIVDIISFMKVGSKTVNAKVMVNKQLMSKLIVYGKSFKSNNIVPTKGLGDFLLYTVLLSGIYNLSNSPKRLLIGMCLVFVGCAINWVIICFIYDKKWYKGFPATFIPFSLVLPLLF